jgi:hypothetical protein
MNQQAAISKDDIAVLQTSWSDLPVTGSFKGEKPTFVFSRGGHTE